MLFVSFKNVIGFSKSQVHASSQTTRVHQSIGMMFFLFLATFLRGDLSRDYCVASNGALCNLNKKSDVQKLVVPYCKESFTFWVFYTNYIGT